MSSGSSIQSKIKVGRLWGYPIIVTTGKSKHEAILLECNTDNPQDFLKQNVEVKIRWKVAMYNESVPAIDVELQNVDIGYSRSRKSSSAAVAVDSKKRKTTASIENPSVVTSGVNVKEEEIETDNDEDIKKPAAVPSSANVKEEEVETDDDEDKKPAAVTSSAIKTEEEIETDDDKEDNRKPAAVTSSGGVVVKTEEIETDEDDGEDDRKPEAVTSSSGSDAFKEETDNEEDEETTLVEFKFCSTNTYCITKDYDLEGTLLIPMLQDATTGLYSLPMGKTSFRGKVDTEEHKKLDSDDYKEFEGSFVKSVTHLQKYSYYLTKFDLGLNVVEYERGRREVYPRENIPAEYTESSYPLKCKTHSHSWEREQGGELVAYKNGNKKRGGVKLYTVLSVHKPNEESPAPLPEGYEPDWDFLVNAYHARLQARDENDKDLGYAQAAVEEYKHFLKLKLKEKKSARYSPSVAIDDVWHTHISFLRRYQCDTLYLTRGKKVIEHLPLLSKDSRRAYNNAYYAHSEKIGKKGRSVDERFWPLPFYIRERIARCG